MEQEIYKREFSAGQIISRAWKMYKENFSRILALALSVTLVQMALSVLLPLAFGGIFTELFGGGSDYLAAFSGALGGLADVVAVLAIAFLVKSRIDGGNPDFNESLGKAVSRWGAAIIANIVMMFFIIGLLLLFIIPGVIFSVYWTFANYAVLFHGKSGIGALKYSKSVVEGRWGKVFWRSLVIGILAVVLYGVSLILIDVPIFFAAGSDGYEKIASSLPVESLSALALGIINSFYYTILAVFFINFDATKKAKAVEAPSGNGLADSPKVSS